VEGEYVIYLDTHVVARLYAGEKHKISEKAQGLINSEEVLISPMVALELAYLFEIGKVATSAPRVLSDLESRIGLKQCDKNFPLIAKLAREQTWTRDPFDRIIVGHAALDRNYLLTADSVIRAHYKLAVW
jgi:PIN domain nuclease of toxin-antitoxin system